MGNFAVNNEQQQYSRGDLLATLVPLIEAISGSSSAFITRTVTTDNSAEILIDNDGKPITTLLITFSQIQGGNNIGCLACNDNVYYSRLSMRNEETLVVSREILNYGTYSIQTFIGAKFVKILSGNGSPITMTYTVR